MLAQFRAPAGHGTGVSRLHLTEPGSALAQNGETVSTTVNSAFSAFDAALNLDPSERRRAQDRHRDIRDVLEETGLVTGSFLQGSFARKTMLKPLKDVDIVILLDAEAWPDLMGPDGPGMAMDMFREYVEQRWPTAQFDQGDPPAGKALRVSFDDVDFTVDLVPGIEDTGRYVLIGDRHERRWIRSNTRIQLDLVSTRNVATDGRFVHQVRMLKSFKASQPELEFVTGIVVESLAYTVVQHKLDHPDAVALVLQEGARLLNGPVLEPAGEDDVTEKWSTDEREAAIRVFSAKARQAQEAQLLAAAGDHASAIDVWHDVLGDEFPSAPRRSEREVLHALASGSLTSTQRPSRTTVGAVQSRPGRAWRSR